MLKIILLVVLVLISGFLVAVAMQPSHFRIARNITITAPPAVVFNKVNDLHEWQQWTPWAKLDPNARLTYKGPISGTGASYEWEGNSDVGAGEMTIMESIPPERIRFNLDFTRPFEATNQVDFTFVPNGDQTVVTWTMSGENSFVGKAISLVVNCDKMVGEQFEKGLSELKKQSEEAAKK